MFTNIRKYLKDSSTGQIVIKVKDESHLLKVYIENGEIVYLSMGTKGPEEILKIINNLEIEEINFIEGIKPLKRVERPLTEEVLKASGIKQVFHSSSDVQISGTFPPDKIQDVIENFIDLTGPLGPVLVDNILKKLGYKKGTSMDGDTYSEFIHYLLEEITPEKRDLFKKKILKEV